MFFDAFDVRRRSQQVFFLWTGDTKRRKWEMPDATAETSEDDE